MTMTRTACAICAGLLLTPLLLASAAQETRADLILKNGRVVTVDSRFSIHPAVAVRAGRVMALGSDREIESRYGGPATEVVDLQGRMVIPGLMDSHTHPTGAAMHEFQGEIPPMESVKDVLEHIRHRAEELPDGEWIELRQVFITRLKERRYPTRRELDEAAPRNPVNFSTGPDSSLNSLALKESGIDAGFTPPDGGPGKVELDEKGQPTGILRSLSRYVKVKPSGPGATPADTERRVLELFRDYLANGITAIADRNASASAVELYSRLRREQRLPLRVSISHGVDANKPLDEVRRAVDEVAKSPLRRPDDWLRIIGVKTFLDGGMLTGSAYMRRPWGVSQVYSITDPDYRGLLFIQPDKLKAIVETTLRQGLQFTAHSVGDGAVEELTRAYQLLNREFPIAGARPCVTHSNFMDPESIARLAEVGGVVDIQPAWLYLDTRTLARHFGYDRLRYFQPLQSLMRAGVVAGGGSDHMQKIGGLRSVNPYNPFLGMEVSVTRRGLEYDRPLHPEEALTREQMLRFYTINNAYLLFRENQTGSLEPGKLADMVVLDRDILACPVQEISKTRVLRTYLQGKLAHQASP